MAPKNRFRTAMLAAALIIAAAFALIALVPEQHSDATVADDITCELQGTTLFVK